jgi:zinc protease
LNNPQKIEIEGPGDTIYLQLSYRSPAANSEDFFALTVIDSLLGGPSSLSMMGGGGVSNKTSRLYQALVEKDLAVSISGGVQATIDPYLYELLAILPPQINRCRAKTIDREITACGRKRSAAGARSEQAGAVRLAARASPTRFLAGYAYVRRPHLV